MGASFSSFVQGSFASAPLSSSLVFSLSLNLIGGAAAVAYQTEKWYDLVGSITNVGIVALAYWGASPAVRSSRQSLLATLSATWGLRLGSFLFARVLAAPDRRFRHVKTNPTKFMIYWMVQALWCVVTQAPLVLALTSEPKDDPGLFSSTSDYVSLALWVAGFGCEVLADRQKTAFKADPANEGKFISSGLWSLSRHPNYAGEILLWLAFYGLAHPVLQGVNKAAILSPLAIAYLILCMSGVPPLEKLADRRWGNVAAYQEYKRSTACVFPGIW